jgi:hypothetical protein
MQKNKVYDDDNSEFIGIIQGYHYSIANVV